MCDTDELTLSILAYLVQIVIWMSQKLKIIMLLSGFVVIWCTLRWQSWCECTYPRSLLKNTNIGAQVAQKLKYRGSIPIEKCPFYIKIYLLIAETSLKQTPFREPMVSAIELIEKIHRIKFCINRQYVRWFNHGTKYV